MDLDLSEAFDVDTVDSFTVTRQSETLINGRSAITQNSLGTVWGTVCLASPNDVKRLPEGTVFSHGISVVTQTQLQGSVAGYQPDLINWNGSQYLVVLVEPYFNAGPGFWQILAQSITTQEAG